MVEASVRSAGLEGLELQIFDLRATDVDAFVAGVEAMDAEEIGCSTDRWSFPTFVEVARRLKANCSDRVIVFGGPSAHPRMLSQEPFRHAAAHVDALVLGEGEMTFVDVVRTSDRSRAGLSRIPGVAVWQADRWERSPARPPVADLDALPSPYRLGLLSHRGVGGMGIVHHYRGCPYKCSFCAWGPLDDPKRVQSADAISAELEAMAAAEAESILCIDAGLNINSVAFENLSTAVERTGVLATRPLRCEVYPTHLTKRQMQFLERSPRPEIGIGLQAWDREVLANLDRPFDEPRFAARVHQLAAIADVTVEIILGLPGDDLDKFKQTFERALQLPAALRVFHAVVLPSALMSHAPEHFALEYNPQSLKMEACFGWTRDDLAEASRYVETATANGSGYTGEYLWLFPYAPHHGAPDLARHSGALDRFDAGESAVAASPVIDVAPGVDAETANTAATDEAAATLARGLVRELFRRSGLRPGKAVTGWTVNAIDLEMRDKIAIADFSRGSTRMRVRFKASGPEPRFARVGTIDISHEDLGDPALNRDVDLLLKLIVAWLRRRGIAPDLSQLLGNLDRRADPAPSEH